MDSSEINRNSQNRLEKGHSASNDTKRSYARSADTWEKSRKRKILRDMTSPPMAPSEVLESTRRSCQFLISSSLPFMHRLYTLVKPAGCVLMLSDSEGLILEALRDEQAASAVDDPVWKFLRAASLYDENSLGYNSICGCLEKGESVFLGAGETYQELLAPYSFQTVPVRLYGVLQGTLSIVSSGKNHEPYFSDLLVLSQSAIEKQLPLMEKNADLSELNRVLHAVLESRTVGYLIYDAQFNIKRLSPLVREVLGLAGATGPAGLREILEDSDLTGKIAEGESFTDEEVVLSSSSGNAHFHVSHIPGHKVILIQENRDMVKMVNRFTVTKKLFTVDDIIGTSRSVKESIKKVKIYSGSNASVLILGESGTGKELMAQAIHTYGQRYDAPFVSLNCGAINKELIQSELFGYEAGAFTGASSAGSPGKFELADGGTLFLDEIGELPLDSQAALLRVLQNGEVSRIGGTKSVSVNVRILAATNRDLHSAVEKGFFRRDLFYRLNVLPLELSPLKDRKEDIPLLIDFFLTKISRRVGRVKPRVEEKAIEKLCHYDWPGNVRELENTIERLFYLCSHNMISEKMVMHQMPRKTIGMSREVNPPGRVSMTLKELEIQAIERTLEFNKGNVRKSAGELGVSRSAFYEKLTKYGILPERYR